MVLRVWNIRLSDLFEISRRKQYLKKTYMCKIYAQYLRVISTGLKDNLWYDGLLILSIVPTAVKV